jgi:hypothetical protein
MWAREDAQAQVAWQQKYHRTTGRAHKNICLTISEPNPQDCLHDFYQWLLHPISFLSWLWLFPFPKNPTFPCPLIHRDPVSLCLCPGRPPFCVEMHLYCLFLYPLPSTGPVKFIEHRQPDFRLQRGKGQIPLCKT